MREPIQEAFKVLIENENDACVSAIFAISEEINYLEIKAARDVFKTFNLLDTLEKITKEVREIDYHYLSDKGELISALTDLTSQIRNHLSQ